MKEEVKKQVILTPVISEKSLLNYKKNKVCTFSVERSATKKDIEYTFKSMFGVDPRKVRTVVSRSESSTRNRKTYVSSTKRSYVKKAYINIGDNTLDIFEKLN